MSVHYCHAASCSERCAPRLFACPAHWRALPQILKDAIHREYRKGQEITKTPSVRYLAVQRRAVGVLAFRPADERAARASAPYFVEAEIWRRRAVDAGHGDPLAGLPGGPAEPIAGLDEARSWALIKALRAEAQRLGEVAT